MTRRRSQRLGLWAGLCLLLCHVQLTHAQQRPTAAPPAYDRLVDEAVREYRAERFERALLLFEQAHQAWPNARSLRGLGRVSLELAHYRAAADYLQAAQTSTVHPLDSALLKETAAFEATARSHLARATVELGPLSAQLRIDGKFTPLPADHTLLLDPGSHHVEASAPGYLPARLTYVLESARTMLWRIELVPMPEAPAPPPTPALVLHPSTAVRPVDRHEEGLPLWRLSSGIALSIAGAAVGGYGVGAYFGYVDQGDRLRRDDSDGHRDQWVNARSKTLLFSGIGAGALTLGAVALADAIPRRDRAWVTPTLIAAGSAALIAGFTLYAGNGCTSLDLNDCSRGIEVRDAGSLLAMLSGPLLAIPATYAVEWLFKQ
ncbi:MAG: hypothetical protein ABW321_24605 [Polyangiales bacterium]